MKNVRYMVLASLFASLSAVCAWLSLPIPPLMVTLQSFGLLLTLATLGGKWGTAATALYLLLGLVGLPVFAGFRGGAGALLDATGGFLWGFLLGALGYWAAQRLGTLAAMVAAMVLCYLCGCLWFQYYAGGISLHQAFLMTVVPYLVPDGIKLWLAYVVSRRLRRHLPK